MKLQRSSWITAVVLTVLMITGNLTAAQAQTLELSPVITQQPASVSIQEAAGQATFNVAYSGEPEPTVRWERSTNQGATWQDLTGSSSVAVAGGQLTLEGLTSDDHGAQVRAVVTNDIGEVIREPAELHIETVVEKLPAEVEAQTPQTPLSQDTPADEQPHIEHAPEITQPERQPDIEQQPNAPLDRPATQPTLTEGDDGTARAPLAQQVTDLLPGTYTITANLYVGADQAPIGQNAYMTDKTLPPLNEQLGNAELTVDQNGSARVTIDLPQEIFTLQSITDGKDVHVQQVERGGAVNFLGVTPPATAPTDRITRLTVTLDHDGGNYTFGPAVQYPTLLMSVKTWDIHLDVDFASATYAGNFDHTFQDVDSDVAVHATAAAGNTDITALTRARLVAAPHDSADAIAEALGVHYPARPNFTAWDVALTQGGQPLTFRQDTDLTLVLPTDYSNVTVYQLVDGVLESVDLAAQQHGAIALTAAQLGTFVLVDEDTAATWEYTKTFDGESGSRLTYRTSGVPDKQTFGIDFPQAEKAGIYQATLGTTADRQAQQQARDMLNVEDGAELTVWTIGFGALRNFGCRSVF